MSKIRTAADVRTAANRLGSPYFSPDTMRFFNSRLLNVFRALNDDGTRGLFVTSERFDHTTPREYRVRLYRFADAGTYSFDVDTLGTFATRSQAETFVRNYTDTDTDTDTDA